MEQPPVETLSTGPGTGRCLSANGVPLTERAPRDSLGARQIRRCHEPVVDGLQGGESEFIHVREACEIDQGLASVGDGPACDHRQVPVLPLMNVDVGQ